MFNTVLSCNMDENKPAASSTGCAVDACSEGLEARGARCIVVGDGGEEAETVNVGVAPMSLTYADPPDNTMVEGTTANCERFGGSLVPSPPAVG